MNPKSKFSVTIPQFAFSVGLVYIAVIVFIVVMQAISGNSTDIAMYVAFGLLLLPGFGLMLMKKLAVQTIMDGFDDMSAYLIANVDESKIKTITKRGRSA